MDTTVKITLTAFVLSLVFSILFRASFAESGSGDPLTRTTLVLSIASILCTVCGVIAIIWSV
jgi:hypothetical protein